MMKNTKILDRYILTMVSTAVLVGIAAFIVVWISPEILFKIIQRVVAKEITVPQAATWFFFEIPGILGKVIPIGILLGTLFVTDMLSRNFELVILRSIGVSFWRIVKPVIIIGTILGIFCFFAYNSFIPYSTKVVSKIKTQNETEYIQFSYLERTPDGTPKQLIITAFDGKKLKYVNAFQVDATISNLHQDNSMKNIIFAENADFKGNELILKDTKVYQLSKMGIYNNIKSYPEISVLKGKSAINAKKLLNSYDVKPDELTMPELLEYLKLLKEEQITDEYNYVRNSLYQRFTQALSCIIFAICGVILGWSKPRENRFIGFTIGAFIMFSYYLTMPFIEMLAKKSILPPIITAILPLAIISVGMFFYAKSKDL